MPVEIARPFLDPHADELLAAAPAPRKALFLDRDGVINVDHGYVHRPEDTEWVSGIFDLCAKAQQAGYLLIVVTNQAGIARGYYSVDEFLAYTRWVHEQFTLKGAPLIATYYCPHHPEFTSECECRKPSPGMISAALTDFEIDAMSCSIVGDKKSDLQAGLRAGLAESRLLYFANMSLSDILSELSLW